jgi:hypothetical protein
MAWGPSVPVTSGVSTLLSRAFLSHPFLFFPIFSSLRLSREETNLEIAEPQLLDANTLLLQTQWFHNV